MSENPLRLGIYGGTFDPVHEAHVALIESAFRYLHLDQIHVVPTRPWQKACFGPERERVSMLKIRLRTIPNLVIDERELERDHPSYSIETLQSFRKEFPNAALFFLLGADQWQNITTWINWEAFPHYANMAVFPRGTDELQNPYAPNYTFSPLSETGSNQTNKSGQLYKVDEHIPPFSSTAIRAAVAAKLFPLEGVSPEVERYIRTHGLYSLSARAL